MVDFVKVELGNFDGDFVAADVKGLFRGWLFASLLDGKVELELC